MVMRYKLIGIDLDGTLLNDAGRVGAENLRAIAAAQKAGAVVVPCTGRAWRESHLVLADTPGLDLGVFVSGAAISEMATGRSLDLAVIEPNLAHDVVQFLYDSPEAVLVFRDSHLAGHDYLVTGRGVLTANTHWWFKVSGAGVHHQQTVGPDDLHHTLRVGLVASEARMREVTAQLKESFADRLFMHYFGAVQLPDNAEPFFVLEIFAAGVDKWRGLSWLARQQGVKPDEIAVIGDQINDLGMMRHAGCAIAMGNAIEQVKREARYVTRSNEESGVAYAIGQLLVGKWG